MGRAGEERGARERINGGWRTVEELIWRRQGKAARRRKGRMWQRASSNSTRRKGKRLKGKGTSRSRLGREGSMFAARAFSLTRVSFSGLVCCIPLSGRSLWREPLMRCLGGPKQGQFGASQHRQHAARSVDRGERGSKIEDGAIGVARRGVRRTMLCMYAELV